MNVKVTTLQLNALAFACFTLVLVVLSLIFLDDCTSGQVMMLAVGGIGGAMSTYAATYKRNGHDD